MMEYAIRVSNLTKYFGDYPAVDDISFNVPKGKIFGLLGSNGAGKTTTINILTGLLLPTEGEVKILGIDAIRDIEEARKLIALVPQTTSLYENLTVYENLEFFGGMYIKNKELQDNIEYILNKLELEEKAFSKVSQLSGGYKRRCSIGCALVSFPSILFLDEPLTGIDLHTRRVILDLIDSMKYMTVVLTTHSMKEAQDICDKIVYLDEGEKILEGSPNKIIRKYSEILGEEISLDFSNSVDVEKVKEFLDKSNFKITGLKSKGKKISFKTKTVGSSIVEVISSLSQLKGHILNVEIKKQKLEDILKYVIEK